MKKAFPFLVFFMVLNSCNDAPLLIEQHTLTQNTITECDNKPCPQVTIDYLSYSGEQEVIAPINKKIEQFIIQSLYLGDPEVNATALTPQEAVEGFIKDYWRDTSEFPEIHEYEAEISIEETYRSKELATVALSQYTYTGGAHGNGSVAYVNFDIKTGEIILNEQLIKDKEGLSKIAEKKLREDYKIPESEDINSTVFWFENDKFYLSEDIGFEEDKVVIHYNQYEIASYADGSIDIELTFSEVAPFLNYSLEKK